MKNLNLANALLIALLLWPNLPAISISQTSLQRTTDNRARILERTLSELEQTMLHRQYTNDIITSRVSRLELRIFGGTQSGTLQHRIDELLVHESDNVPADIVPTTSRQSSGGTPPPAPSRFVKAVQTLTQSQIDQQVIEQRSWAASAIIDGLLTAIEKADSQTLNNSMSKLYESQPVSSNIAQATLNQAGHYHERGVTAFTQGKFNDALSSFQQALVANPSDISIINDLVKTQIKINDLKTAIFYCPVAIATAPSSATAWCNMAEIFARAKQSEKARDCAYLAYLMSEDADKALETIKEALNNITEPNVRTPFKQALLMAQYTPDNGDDNSSDGGKQVGFVGPDMDIALYKMNMLLRFAPALQQIKPDSGIILAVTISRAGKVLQNEVLHSAGDTTIDKVATSAVTDAKLSPLPKSTIDDRQQFLVSVDKVVKVLSDV